MGKDKKPRKRKKKSRRESISNTSSSDEWVEKTADANMNEREKEKPVRDDWMTGPFNFLTSSNSKERNNDKAKEAEEKHAQETKMYKSRELNPYLNNGGTGLPEGSGSSSTKNSVCSSTVGDQGAEWLYKALRRAKERAREENRSLEDVAAERWGSLDNLKKLIKQAESRRHTKNSDRNSNKFIRPTDDDSSGNDDTKRYAHSSHRRHHGRTKGWRKPKHDANENGLVSPKVEEEKVLKFNNEKATTDLSDKEMNILASKILKAEIMGDEKLAKSLSEQLERARSARESSKSTRIDKTDETIILTRTNDQGFTQPVNKEEHSSKRRNKFETYKDGKRARYFEDDEKYSLKEMFEREKMITSHEQNSEFAKMTSKEKRCTNDDDDLYMDQTQDISKADSQTSRAISQHKRTQRALDNCLYCLNSGKLRKHLIISTREKSYLSVPACQSLTDGHCLIAPIYHSTCSVMLDEDVWNEMKEYCRDIVQLYKRQDEDVIFFEVAMNFKTYPHMVLHCIPVSAEAGSLAPMYFKKAILECETEWAINKKLVDVRSMNVKHSIPKGLPYFMVHFGMDFGYAHVIEDEKRFPRNFAQEIIGGMMDIDYSVWRKNKVEDVETQVAKTLRLKSLWKEYNDS